MATPEPRPACAVAESSCQVVIMRGISGSGKSTYVRRLLEEHGVGAAERGIGGPGERFCVCSADDYFVRKDGTYRFNWRELAHGWCQARFLEALHRRCSLIVLDNTHTQLWEYDALRKAARLAEYDVQVVELRVADEASLRRVSERNRHGVSFDAALAQWRRFERDPAAKVVPATLG